MSGSIAFIAFFAIWLLWPPLAAWVRWTTATTRQRVLMAATTIALWLLLAMVLFFMHCITYGGILRRDFWLS